MLSDLMKFCKQYFIVSRYSGFVIRAESLECGCLPDFLVVRMYTRNQGDSEQSLIPESDILQPKDYFLYESVLMPMILLTICDHQLSVEHALQPSNLAVLTESEIIFISYFFVHNAVN